VLCSASSYSAFPTVRISSKKKQRIKTNKQKDLLKDPFLVELWCGAAKKKVKVLSEVII